MESDRAEFCTKVHPELVRVLTVHCGDRRVAEELAQESLARAIAQWSRVGAMQYPKAWVYRVAFNLASSRWRRARVERRAIAGLDSSGVDSDPAVGCTERSALRDALAQLPPRQRAAVALRYLSDLSADDTAAVLNCKPSTVRSLTSQAATSLRAHLASLEEPATPHQRTRSEGNLP